MSRVNMPLTWNWGDENSQLVTFSEQVLEPAILESTDLVVDPGRLQLDWTFLQTLEGAGLAEASALRFGKWALRCC